MSLWQPSPPLFIGKARGRMGTSKIPKMPMYGLIHKGIKGINGASGAPWRTHTCGRPSPSWGPLQGGFLAPKPSRSLLGKYPKRWLSKKISKKHFHYSQRHFSASVKSQIISVCLEQFLYPLKQFWTHSETIPEQCFYSAKSNQSGSGSSRTFLVFIPENSHKFPEHFWHPPRISRHVPKPIWLNGIPWNNFLVLPKLFQCSLCRTFPLSETFLVSETFPVIFSQTPCLVFSR